MAASPAVQSLPVIQVGDDTVTLIGAHLAHVTSKSQPGMLHSVTDYRCSCKGFYHRNRCRHLEAMRTARKEFGSERCICGNPWTIKIDGRLYCALCAPAPMAEGRQ
jgi:hypothetical protein